MIGKFFTYFGWIGTASVVCWMAALGWAVARSRHPRRYRFWFQALGIAVLGAVLARINSNAISAIETDRTEQWAAHQEAVRQRRAQLEVSEEPGKIRVRFAEDARGEEREGADQASLQDAGTPGTEWEPEYRRRGRQMREPGKKQDLANSVETLSEDQSRRRRMKEADVLMANRLDRYNLWAVRTVLGILGILIAGDYLWRHNRITGAYLPLPIGGAWLDAFCPRQYSALISPGRLQEVPRLLEASVRKGESVLFFGPRDPWPDRDQLPVVSVAGKSLWDRRKIVAGERGLPPETEFLWDSAWFARYVVVVTGEEEARQRQFDDWLGYLRRRARTRARARRTVNVAWVGPSLPEPAVEEALRLGPDMNIRLFYAAHPESVSPGADQIRFEEVL